MAFTSHAPFIIFFHFPIKVEIISIDLKKMTAFFAS